MSSDLFVFRLPAAMRHSTFVLNGPNQSGGTYQPDKNGIVIVDPYAWPDGRGGWVHRTQNHNDALKFIVIGSERLHFMTETAPPAVPENAKPAEIAAPAAPVHVPVELADQLIAAEIAKQDGMWGETNERADASKSQILRAATAQCVALSLSQNFAALWPGGNRAEQRVEAFNKAKHDFYPTDWSGFRDYGSDVANMVVAAAYLRNEIKRRIRNGESTYRAPRDAKTQPYDPATTPRS